MTSVKVTLRTPERRHGEVVTLNPGAALLVGSAPDVARLDGAVAAQERFEPHVIASPRVSRQHALLWLESDGSLGVRDLGSTNGSQVVASRRTTIRVTPGDGAIIDLAMPPFKFDEPPSIPDAEWCDTKPLHEAVRESLASWLSQRGMPASVEVVQPDAPSRAGTLLSVGFVDGHDVRIVFDGTERVGWRGEYEQIASYLHRQKKRWERVSRHDPDFVCESPSFRRAHDQVCEAAERGLPLVLLGPSGAGKTRLARCYHDHSAWHDGPFIEWSPSGTKDESLLSELFGHKRGAFTGAHEDRIGLLEAAHSGTLFLDEIGDLPLEAQARLLKFLDNGRFRRLGDVAERTSKVHVVSATNRPLHEMIWSDKLPASPQVFRADLWYRLAGAVVHLPPLSKRPEDVRAFLARQRLAGAGTVLAALSPAALENVLSQEWPGGLRELANFCQRLPCPAAVGGLDEGAVSEALLRGAPDPGSRSFPEPRRRETHASGELDWDDLSSRAWAAFRHAQAGPGEITLRSLDSFFERFFKPLVVAEMSSREAGRPPDRDMLDERGLFSRVARRLQMAEPQRAKAYFATYLESWREPAGGTD